MIKPIETRYAGYRFRSRLEARWAVFFDTLGIKWEYEPEGFETPDGPYLPDFRLHLPYSEKRIHDSRVYFEVKPEHERGHNDPRWFHLAKEEDLYVAFGMNIPTEETNQKPNGSLYQICSTENGDYADSLYYFTWCPRCKRTSISFLGSCVVYKYPDVDGPWTVGGDCRDGLHAQSPCCNMPYRGGAQFTPRCFRIMDAYTAARSARFEHGERG